MAAAWFHHLGYTMPYGVNAADYLLDLASGEVTTAKLDGEAGRLHMVACADKFAAAYPSLDGYREGCTLDEGVFGDLWHAAQVESLRFDALRVACSCV